MSNSDSDALSPWDFAAVFFTSLSAIATYGIFFGSFAGDVITPGALAFLFGVILDFFSGRNWLAKLAVVMQFIIAGIVLVGVSRFLGGMDH